MGRPRKRPPPPGPVTAADVIAFIETVCFVPEGKFVGQPLKLEEWQKDILRAIYDNPHGTRRAIISMGRKNAKSTLSACLLLAHLCGAAGAQQAEFAIVLRRPEPRPGGDHLLVGVKDGPHQPDARRHSQDPRERQDAEL
jgi:hypothetical protein